jgi:hypothetical protein
MYIYISHRESRDVHVKLIRNYLRENVCAKFPKPRFGYLSALPPTTELFPRSSIIIAVAEKAVKPVSKLRQLPDGYPASKAPTRSTNIPLRIYYF